MGPGKARFFRPVETKAGRTLDLLKTLRGYADDVKDRSKTLRSEMLGNSYEDWVNTMLLPLVFEAKSADETVDKTYDLEKSNVKQDLKTAKGGDYNDPRYEQIPKSVSIPDGLETVTYQVLIRK